MTGYGQHDDPAWCSRLGWAAGDQPAVLSLSHRNVTCLIGSDPLRGAAPEQLVLCGPAGKTETWYLLKRLAGINVVNKDMGDISFSLFPMLNNNSCNSNYNNRATGAARMVGISWITNIPLLLTDRHILQL